MKLETIVIDRQPEITAADGYLDPIVSVNLPIGTRISVSERENQYITTQNIMRSINSHLGQEPAIASVIIKYVKAGDNWHPIATIKLECNRKAYEARAEGKDVVEAVTKAYVIALYSPPKRYYRTPFS